MPVRILLVSCSFALTVCLTQLVASPQRGKTPAPDLPPISQTCPMHPDVVETKPGTCPICKMNLIPVRLEAIWTCPIHAVVSEAEPGVCRICRRDLIQMTVALTWTCADRSDINEINRGKCPDGTPMVAKRTLRPHGNHNPQHGGQFFMAPDNYHHLEGAHPRTRVFRLYLYDDYARPLKRDELKRVKARVVTKEHFDTATRVTKELAAFPLVRARNGSYVEARIDTASLPAQMTAKVRFKDDAPEYRFDFTFQELSKEPPAPSAAASSAAATSERGGNPAAEPAAAVASIPAPAAERPASEGAPTQPQPPIPDSVAEILALLTTHREQIAELVQRGDFAAVWVPAFQAKDLAVALEPRAHTLAPARREEAGPAIARLVRMAWLLDAYGDLGNRQQITDAYVAFAEAVADVTAAFGQ